MTQPIDTLSFLDPPGRMVQVFKFEGTCWEITATAPNGKSHKSPSGERQSILIAAQTAWIAHTFVNCHVYSLQPDKITCFGHAWMAPDIDRHWTPEEYEYREMAINTEQISRQQNQAPQEEK